MTRLMLALATLAAVAAPAAGAKLLPPAAPAGQLVFYGHVISLTPSGAQYTLRFDPAWLLEGSTAEKAAVADGVLAPGESVPDDNYTRDESHKTLTFVLPKTAKITVVTNGPHGIANTPVTVAEFVQLLKGKNPNHRQLSAPAKAFGYWAVVKIDKVQSLDGQFHP